MPPLHKKNTPKALPRRPRTGYDRPMNELLTKKCVPCEGGVKPIPVKEAKKLLSKIPGWKLAGGKALRLELSMLDFPAAIEFIHDVAQTAESEDHHPDLHLTGYRNLAIE